MHLKVETLSWDVLSCQKGLVPVVKLLCSYSCVLSARSPPFHALLCDTGAGTLQTTFLFCRLLTVWLCQQDIPSSGGICAWPPEPLLSEMSAPVGSARLRGLSFNNVGSSPKSLALSLSSFFLCSLGLAGRSCFLQLLPQ